MLAFDKGADKMCANFDDEVVEIIHSPTFNQKTAQCLVQSVSNAHLENSVVNQIREFI